MTLSGVDPLVAGVYTCIVKATLAMGNLYKERTFIVSIVDPCPSIVVDIDLSGVTPQTYNLRDPKKTVALTITSNMANAETVCGSYFYVATNAGDGSPMDTSIFTITAAKNLEILSSDPLLAGVYTINIKTYHVNYPAFFDTD